VTDSEDESVTTKTDESIVYPTTEDADFDITSVAIKAEVANLRTANTKTFLRMDGTFVVAIYGETIHYEKDGKFYNIDNRLSYSDLTDSYRNTANTFSIDFPETITDGKSISLTQGEYEIKWRVDNVKNSTIAYDQKSKTSEDLKQLTKIKQTVQYDTIQDGVKLEYLVNGDAVKENIILEKYIKDFSLSFTYTLSGLSLSETADKKFAFINDSGESVFTLGSLNMYDCDESMSESIKMTVKEMQKGIYQITLTPDDAWLKTATFPVTIDPTIKSSLQEISIWDTYASEAAPDANFFDSQVIKISSVYASSEYRGFLKFSLPSIIMDKQITYSRLTLRKYSGTANPNNVIFLHKNTTNFNQLTLTWKKRPDYSSDVTDYHIVGNSNYYIFDITKTVKEWQENGNILPYGFTIKLKNDSGIYNSVRSMQYDTGTDSDPVVEIGYIDPAGIKDYWTYNTQSVGIAGTGYVSDNTGLLTFVRTDLSFETAKQNLSLSFAYSVFNRSNDVGYGRGWNVIYNQRVLYRSELGLFYTEDFTGNIVYYHPMPSCDSRISFESPEVDSCYLAEDGSGNVLVRQLTSETLTGQYILNKDNIKYDFGTDGYLDLVIDEYGLGLTIVRYSSYKNQILSITDSSGNVISLSYINLKIASATLGIKQTDGTLYEVRKVLYSDTDSISAFIPTVVSYQSHYDSSDIMTTYDSLYYVYDTTYRLTQAYVDYQESVNYSYTTGTNKIATISSAYNGYAFSSIDFDYDYKVTTITDQNDDFIIYKFDDYGHTINLLDSFGKAQFYHYVDFLDAIDLYPELFTLADGTPNYYLNNKLISTSNPQTTLYNPVNNSGFEYSTVYQESNWSLVIDAQAGASIETEYVRDSENALIGSFSGELNVTGIQPDYGHIEQTLTLDYGTYTLIGYAKNDTGDANNVIIDIVGEDWADGSGIIPNNGEWTKIVIIFDVNEDDTEVSIWLTNHALGKAYFDCIQIIPWIEGFTDTRKNSLENPSFETVDSEGELPGWSFSDEQNVYRSDAESDVTALYESILGDYGICINGSASESRWAATGIWEFMETGPLEETGSLIIGAWAYSIGTPSSKDASDLNDGNNRPFRIRIDFLASDLTRFASDYVDFDSGVEGWQYSYKKIELPSSIHNIYGMMLYLEYQGEGWVYFDGLQAYFEHSFTNFTFNKFGDLKKKEASSTDITEYEYADRDYSSNPIQVKLSDGSIIDIIPGETPLPEEIIYCNVSIMPSYNDNGQVTSIKIGDDEDYFTTSTTYLHLSQYVASSTDEFGQTTSYVNNTMTGMLEAIANAKGQYTHYLYDNEGRLIEVRSTGGSNPESGIDAQVEYMYDELDRLEYIVMDDGYCYKIVYDLQGRMESVAVNNQTLMSYTYKQTGTYYTGLIATQTYGNGDAIKFIYNDQNQVIKIQYKASGTTVYETRFGYHYDQNGNIAIYDLYEDGIIESSEYYTYDSSGHLIKTVDTSGNTTEYLYDNSGNLTSLYFKIDGNEATTNYAYNECFVYDGAACILTSSLYDNTEYTSQSNLDVL
ncbi:MAG: DNRLRE domain-containing protein, partial [Candidatus Izemoplasmatales bacterium]